MSVWKLTLERRDYMVFEKKDAKKVSRVAVPTSLVAQIGGMSRRLTIREVLAMIKRRKVQHDNVG